MSNNLWLTIQNMTASEKLFFRRQFGSIRIPLHIVLYDKIVKQKTYNEHALLKHKQLSKNLNYIKHTLLKALYISLVEFSSQHDTEMQLMQDIIMIKTLRLKNQTTQALKILKKAIDKTSHYEYHTIGKLLIDEYMKIILFNSTDANINDVGHVIELSKPMIIKQTDTVRVKSIYLSILNLRKKSNLVLDTKDFETLDTFLKDLQLLSVDTSNSKAMNFYRMSLASVYYMQGEFTLAWQYCIENIAAWQNNVQNIATEPEFYIDSLILYTDTGILLKQFNTVLDSINHSCNSHLRGNYALMNFDILKFRCLNRIYNKTAKYENVSRLITANKNNYDTWINFSNDETKTLLSNSIGIAHFVIKKYDDSYHYIYRTIQSFTNASRKEVQSFAYLFIVLVCYELNNVSQFESQYRSSYSFFYRHKSLFKFEKLILQTLYAIFRKKNADASKQKIQLLLDTLDKTKHEVSQQFIFNIFNFPLWFKSKLLRKDYREVVKESLLNNNDIVV